ELGEAGVTPVTTGVFTLGWIVLIGGLVVLVNVLLPSARATRSAARAAQRPASEPEAADDWEMESDWDEDLDDLDGDDDLDRDDEAQAADDQDTDDPDGDDPDGDDPDEDPSADAGYDAGVDAADTDQATAPRNTRVFKAPDFDFGEMDLDEYDTERAISRKLNDRM
ncbi:MAG: hypothetical protein WAV90_07200, partial [Gordonia amarae]